MKKGLTMGKMATEKKDKTEEIHIYPANNGEDSSVMEEQGMENKLSYALGSLIGNANRIHRIWCQVDNGGKYPRELVGTRYAKMFLHVGNVHVAFSSFVRGFKYFESWIQRRFSLLKNHDVKKMNKQDKDVYFAYLSMKKNFGRIDRVVRSMKENNPVMNFDYTDVVLFSVAYGNNQ